MSKAVLFIIVLLIVLTLTACGDHTPTDSSNTLATAQVTETPILDDEDASLESYGEVDEDNSKICYVCGTVYSEGGYIVKVGSNSIDMCKECRDELLLKNGFIMFDGKKEYPFSTYKLYTDELVSIPIPDDYHVTEVSDEFHSDIWKAEFHYNDDDDIFLLFGWEDFFEGEDIRPSLEDRLEFSMNRLYENINDNTDSEDDADMELANLFAHEEYQNCMSLDMQGLRHLIVFYSKEFISMYTIDNGVVYYYAAAMLSDINYDEDEQPEPGVDMIILGASAIYPSVEKVTEFFDN